MPKRELRINLWANCNANAGRMITPTHAHTHQKNIKFTFAILVISRQVSEKAPEVIQFAPDRNITRALVIPAHPGR